MTCCSTVCWARATMYICQLQSPAVVLLLRLPPLHMHRLLLHRLCHLPRRRVAARLVSSSELRMVSTSCSRPIVECPTIWLLEDVVHGLAHCLLLVHDRLHHPHKLHVPLWMASASLSGISMLNSCHTCQSMLFSHHLPLRL
jgi:hypothetical protein